ncbi:MAG: NAD(P)-binding domain-containing protein [Thiotrichaceae bacterium]|nr:NAD(P)-binding domain-containing protein [Thiotrichaceae bacterium]
MEILDSGLWFYILIVGSFLLIHIFLRKRAAYKSAAIQQESIEAGLTEPASLHPVVDFNLCQGSGACVSACPEAKGGHKIIGMIKDKAYLVDPSSCIGHGACAVACPFDAISLVFGSATRGVELPAVNSNFETNVPGVYIAGELGGMGLIRNAITQGKQAVESIASKKQANSSNKLDLLIVGAGPAGFSASLAAKQHKLNYLTIEQESLGGTVFKFPRGKLVMTAPVDLPLIGKVNMREISKEGLLEFWTETAKEHKPNINYKEKIEKVIPGVDGIDVITDKSTYRADAILLAIGRRGTPRALGVPGEEQSKVIYQMVDPEQYQNKHVLVVGGGDSALEAAHSIAAVPGTTVSLSYRSGAFSRAKGKNRKKIDQAVEDGRISLFLNSQVKSFSKNAAIISLKETEREIKNDAAIVCVGGILPTGFLKEVGIQIDTKFGTL